MSKTKRFCPKPEDLSNIRRLDFPPSHKYDIVRKKNRSMLAVDNFKDPVLCLQRKG